MADLVIDDTIEAIVLPNGEELELGKTPTGNIDITQAGVTDVSEYATATVPQGEIKTYTLPGQYYTESNARKWRIRSWAGVIEGDSEGHRGWIDDETETNSDYRVFNAVASSTSVTPTESAQTIGGANYMMEGAVTVAAIPSNYVGSGVTQRSSSDLTASGATVTVPSGYYANQATKNVASGSATAPASISDTGATASSNGTTITLSKTVSNTPQVSAGYVASGTAGNSSVSLSATDSNFTAENIKSGVSLFGKTGSYTGGGGSGLTLLKSTSLGAMSTSSTSPTDTGKTITVTGYNDYDVLVVDISVDTPTNGRHTSTVSMVYLTGTSAVTTKNTYAVGSNKWNSKLSSAGAGSTRQSSTAYGIYVNAATVSGNTMTFTLYYRYHSTYAGTINGSYTARVYGLKLYDLIGG